MPWLNGLQGMLWFFILQNMTSKKLLVLDVNGLLVDTYFYKEPLPDESPDARVGNFYGKQHMPYLYIFISFKKLWTHILIVTLHAHIGVVDICMRKAIKSN